MTNTIAIKTDTRSAVVPLTVRVVNRTTRTLAGQAVLSMLHAWNTASACAAYKHLQVAAGDTLLYAASAVAS